MSWHLPCMHTQGSTYIAYQYPSLAFLVLPLTNSCCSEYRPEAREKRQLTYSSQSYPPLHYFTHVDRKSNIRHLCIHNSSPPLCPPTPCFRTPKHGFNNQPYPPLPCASRRAASLAATAAGSGRLTARLQGALSFSARASLQEAEVKGRTDQRSEEGGWGKDNTGMRATARHVLLWAQVT